MEKNKNIFHGKMKWLVVVGIAVVVIAAVLLIFAMMDEAKVKVDKKVVKLDVGQSRDIEIKAVEKNKALPKMEYSSSNNSVATVNEKGEIFSKRGGECTISAKTPRGQKLKVKVLVKAPKEKKVMYLTFDDGPSSAVTGKVLDVLDKYKAKATFFVIGKSAEEVPDTLSDIISKGHTVGIHSYSQDYNKIYKTAKSYIDDFDKTEKIIKKAGYEPKYWRFPGGGSNDFVLEEAQAKIMDELHKRGYTEMDWNSNISDGSGNAYDAKKLFELGVRSINATILTGDSPVVLLHDSNMQPYTAKALDSLLKYYKKKGYKFKGLNEYSGPELSFGKN